MKQTKKIAQKNVEKKSQPKKIKDVTVNDDNEVMRLIKIILVVIVIIVVFFGITYLVTHKNSNKKEEKPTEIQYTEILVGEIWNKGGTYFVLAGPEEDQFLSLYNYYLSLYKEKNSDVNYYLLNLDSVFNRKYVGETSNLYTSNPNQIRFKGTTLLKVSEGKVVEAYEGKDAISNYLENLIK